MIKALHGIQKLREISKAFALERQSVLRLGVMSEKINKSKNCETKMKTLRLDQENSTSSTNRSNKRLFKFSNCVKSFYRNII